MSKRQIPPIRSSDITPEAVYLNRRQFMQGAALVAGGVLLAACAPKAASTPVPTVAATFTGQQDELGNKLTAYEAVTGYNNYYEFTTDKAGVAPAAAKFKTSPWEVEVYGLVNKPKKYGLEDLIKQFQPEEHIYRLRCVEAWSMVIPWIGFPLSKLLKEVEPTSEAKYVRFETVTRPDEMPGESDNLYPWPYQEGLRMDEAMNDLVIIATGMYGGELPAQNGGGMRLVVPWKYGFKSIKAVVKIEFVTNQPSTMWSTIAPNEYGFYSNVNPQVDHPRWSQATERRIGELSRRDTLMFNGYAAQVAHLYDGMDLVKNY